MAREQDRQSDGADRSEYKLEELFSMLEQQTEGHRDIRVQDLFDAFPERVFGPVLLIPAILALSPLGAIPTVPTFIGLILILVAGQRLIGIRRPWIPRRLLDRGIERNRVEAAIQRIRPWARRIDHVIKPRLQFVLIGPMANVSAGLVVVLAACMPPLELIPFAALMPALGITLLALAMTAADGLLALFGGAAAIGTAVILIRAFLL